MKWYQKYILGKGINMSFSPSSLASSLGGKLSVYSITVFHALTQIDMMGGSIYMFLFTSLPVYV